MFAQRHKPRRYRKDIIFRITDPRFPSHPAITSRSMGSIKQVSYQLEASRPRNDIDLILPSLINSGYYSMDNKTRRIVNLCKYKYHVYGDYVIK